MKEEITLAYAAEFIFKNDKSKKFFKIGKKEYQYIDTVYDRRDSDGGTNTIVVVYDFKKQKYDAFLVNDFSIGEQQIEFV